MESLLGGFIDCNGIDFINRVSIILIGIIIIAGVICSLAKHALSYWIYRLLPLGILEETVLPFTQIIKQLARDGAFEQRKIFNRTEISELCSNFRIKGWKTLAIQVKTSTMCHHLSLPKQISTLNNDSASN